MNTVAYFDNNEIQQVIASELRNANVSIYVAVAWLTDNILIDILKSKGEQGVEVIVIYNNDKINQASAISTSQFYNVKVYPIAETLMHHKFCIVDNYTIISGSYNWTQKASKDNIENIKVTKGDSNLVKQYFKEFKSILAKYHNVEIDSSLYLPRSDSNRFYKFNNLRFFDVASFTNYIMSNKGCWEDAVVHYKNKFIIEWIRSINDFDTLVQLDKFRNKFQNSTEEEEFFFITVYNNPQLEFGIDGVYLSSIDELLDYKSLEFIVRNKIRFDKFFTIYKEYTERKDVVGYMDIIHGYIKLLSGNLLGIDDYEYFKTYVLLKTTDLYVYKGEIDNVFQLNKMYRQSDLESLKLTHYVPEDIMLQLSSVDFNTYETAIGRLNNLDTHEKYREKQKIKYLPKQEQELLKIIENYGYILPDYLKEQLLNNRIQAEDIVLVDYPENKDLLGFLNVNLLYNYYNKYHTRNFADNNSIVLGCNHKYGFTNISSGKLMYGDLLFNKYFLFLDIPLGYQYMYKGYGDLVDLARNSISYMYEDVLHSDYQLLIRKIDSLYEYLRDFSSRMRFSHFLDKQDVLFDPHKRVFSNYDRDIRMKIKDIADTEKKLKLLADQLKIKKKVEDENIIKKERENKEVDIEFLKDYLENLKLKINGNEYKYVFFDINHIHSNFVYYKEGTLTVDSFIDFFKNKRIETINCENTYLFRENIREKLSVNSKYDELGFSVDELGIVKSREEYILLQDLIVKKYNDVFDFAIGEKSINQCNADSDNQLNHKEEGVRLALVNDGVFKYKGSNRFYKELPYRFNSDTGIVTVNGFIGYMYEKPLIEYLIRYKDDIRFFPFLRIMVFKDELKDIKTEKEIIRENKVRLAKLERQKELEKLELEKLLKEEKNKKRLVQEENRKKEMMRRAELERFNTYKIGMINDLLAKGCIPNDHQINDLIRFTKQLENNSDVIFKLFVYKLSLLITKNYLLKDNTVESLIINVDKAIKWNYFFQVFHKNWLVNKISELNKINSVMSVEDYVANGYNKVFI